MSSEQVTLRQRKGEPVEATAEVVRYGSGERTTRAGSIAGAGVVLGGLSILIPGVHLISTWLLPLLGLGIASYYYRIRAKVGRITGTCPSCGEAMSISDVGTVTDEAVWVRCDKCSHPLELVLAES
ncbi:MAG TPA: hypothetical protein ENK18_07115 [Deltaproteobacteria bacterium]|nr:hypothetical protein [Deltaproteobacteria bacterium]